MVTASGVFRCEEGVTPFDVAEVVRCDPAGIVAVEHGYVPARGVVAVVTEEHPLVQPTFFSTAFLRGGDDE